jgi:hypothetical protein
MFCKESLTDRAGILAEVIHPIDYTLFFGVARSLRKVCNTTS